MTVSVELYRFVESLGGTDTVTLWASSDAPVVYGGETYAPAAISRGDPESSNELSKADLTVTVSIDNTIARGWMQSSLDSLITLTVLTKEDDDVTVVWKGRLASIKPADATIELLLESVFTSLRRPGLRQKYQRVCPHVLYGKGCNLNKAGFAVAGTATAISGASMTISAAASYPVGYFTYGMLETAAGVYRMITNHSGSSITLVRPVDFDGDFNVIIYPGCDRTVTTCNDKFGNRDNFGGFPYIPLKNPFNGSSIV